MIKSLPTIVQSNQIDALIINYLNYYVELAAVQLDIPYIHVYAGMHFDFSHLLQKLPKQVHLDPRCAH